MPSIIRTGLGCLLVILCSCNVKDSRQKKLPEPILAAVADNPIQFPSWVTISYVMGQFDPAAHPDFVIIDAQYADREGLYLRKEAYSDFQKMSAAALAAGHQMVIRSATRNFNYQKGIWERKWQGETTLEGGMKASDIADPVRRAKKILLYSSMPGTSRHHWGTDIDLNSFENSYFENGKGLALYNWMLENAGNFGFCQPYTNKSEGRTGYEEEKWHWSYMPLSGILTQYSQTHIENKMIQGFEGDTVAAEVDMLENYILGIDSNCLN